MTKDLNCDTSDISFPIPFDWRKHQCLDYETHDSEVELAIGNVRVTKLKNGMFSIKLNENLDNTSNGTEQWKFPKIEMVVQSAISIVNAPKDYPKVKASINVPPVADCNVKFYDNADVLKKDLLDSILSLQDKCEVELEASLEGLELVEYKTKIEGMSKIVLNGVIMYYDGKYRSSYNIRLGTFIGSYRFLDESPVDNTKMTKKLNKKVRLDYEANPSDKECYILDGINEIECSLSENGGYVLSFKNVDEKLSLHIRSAISTSHARPSYRSEQCDLGILAKPVTIPDVMDIVYDTFARIGETAKDIGMDTRIVHQYNRLYYIKIEKSMVGGKDEWNISGAFSSYYNDTVKLSEDPIFIHPIIKLYLVEEPKLESVSATKSKKTK